MNKSQTKNVSDDRNQTQQHIQQEETLLNSEEQKILNENTTSEKCILQKKFNYSDIVTATTTAKPTNNFVLTTSAAVAIINQGTMLPATEDYATTTTTTTTTTTKTSTNEATIGNTPNTNAEAVIASAATAAAAANAAIVSGASLAAPTANAQTAGESANTVVASNNALENEGQQLTGNNTNALNCSKVVNEVSAKAVDLPTTAEAAKTTITASTTTSPLQSPSASAVPLPHVASEPTFGVQMRTHQQQKIKSYHDTKQTTVWRTESIASNPSPNCTNTNEENGTRTSTGPYGGDNGGGMGSVASSFGYGTSSSNSVSSSSHTISTQPRSEPMRPKRRISEHVLDIKRRVSFPESDKDLVTGCLEPANPWEQACRVNSISEIAELYVQSCHKHNTVPLPAMLEHLKVVDLNSHTRQTSLSLKAIKLTPNDCEPLEEIFKRIQYKSIDLSECSLDESSVSALFEMFEYYEATNELDISSNKLGMTNRGWTSCTYMVGRSQELQLLNAEGNPISKHSAEGLGSALNTSNMHTLKLEHCGLKGAPLTSFCSKLQHNKVLKELWLAYNDLDCTDAAHIADLLRFNHYIELVDISNNNIRDEGMMYLVQALLLQSAELERRSNMRRAAAIEDDESFSPVELTAPAELKQIGYNEKEDIKKNIEDTKPTMVAAITNVGGSGVGGGDGNSNTTQMERFNDCHEKTQIIACVDSKSCTVEHENEADDDTEDTMRTPVTNAKSSANQISNTATGQSMLDKLLSMNSDSSSSDDGPSIISTDTLAACGSEDISVISDEIYDAATTTSTTNTSTNIRSMLAPASASASTTTATTASTLTTGMTSATTDATNMKVTTIMLDSLAAASKDKRESPTETLQSVKLETNLCDIKNLTEATNVVLAERSNEIVVCSPSLLATHNNSTSSSSSSSNNSNNSNNNNNSNNSNGNNNNTITNNSSSNSGNGSCHNDSCNTQNNSHLSTLTSGPMVTDSNASSIFELTAEESDCINGAAGGATRPLDMNKNNMKSGEDYEDTHSTDSAFESASEGDISRHLPDEFSRLSASLESTRLDDMTKEMAIETATIATESTECLAMAEEAASTPTPSETTNFGRGVVVNTNMKAVSMHADAADDDNVFTTPPPPPKVTIAAECLTLAKEKDDRQGPSPSPVPTPPPPSTSPGGVSVCSMRRTESTIAYLNQSTRNHSHSSDSLCSENSLDGSTTSNDHNFAEKLTKNDTLSRRHLVDTFADATHKSQSGLKALTVWSNNLTKGCGNCIAELLSKTVSLELLNVGKNCLSNDFVDTIKDSLIQNTTLTTLGLQSAHLSAKGIDTLASILTFGGNSKLQRIDIRDNKIEVESLNTIAEVLKSNKTITQIDINDEPKRLTIGSDAHLDYARVLENVRSMCSRNEKIQAQLQAEKSASLGGNGGGNNSNSNSTNRCRGGYYLGSRKISLTCHSRPLVDAVTGTVVGSTIAVSSATPTPAAKLEVKRKTGVRLRSPVPSPPTVSPSSSPNRSRFQVSRVQEISPLTSPLAQIPPPHPPIIKTTTMTSSSCVSIPTATASAASVVSTLPTSSSLPAMASATSSTQTIKRLTVNPRSRFHVSRIYEDLQVPVTNREMPPITPPLNPPPTPMLKSARKAAAAAAAAATAATTTVVIVEPPTTTTTTKSETATTITASNATNLSPQATQSSNSSSSTTSPVSLNSNSSPSSASPTSSSSSLSSEAAAVAAASENTASPSPSSASTAALASSSSTASTKSSSSSTGSASSSGSTGNSCSSFSDSTDSVGVTARLAHDVPKSCPIAVFGDNDITLTKESAATLVLSNNAAQERNAELAAGMATAAANEAQQQQLQQQRTRKSSWIATQSTVDKLLTLFNTSTIFQRSASPEPKTGGSQCTINNEMSTTNAQQQLQQQQQQPEQQQQALVAARKTTPPSWSKFGTELLNASLNSNEQNNSSGGGSGSNAEQSRSFLDVASRQFRDLSKQVFRPNISFGNDVNNSSSSVNSNDGTTTITTATTNTSLTSSGGSSNASPMPVETTLECDAAHIPLNLKRELKENISPEHTINEETLHSLQKLAKQEESAAAAAAAKALEPNDDICDIEIVTHDELTDCCKKVASVTTATGTGASMSSAATAAANYNTDNNTSKEQEVIGATTAQNT